MSVTVNVCISALEAEIASFDYLDMDNERMCFSWYRNQMETAPTELDWDVSVPFDRCGLAWVMQSVSSAITENCLSLTMTTVPRLGTTGWGSCVLWRKPSLMSCVTVLLSAITIVQAGLAQREGLEEKVCVRCRACCPCRCLQEPTSLGAFFFTQKPQACTGVSDFPSISPQFSCSAREVGVTWQ